MDRDAVRSLMADYLEGELDERQRVELADALEHNPEWAAEFDDALWMEGLLRTACEGVKAATTPITAPTGRPVVASGRFTIHQPGKPGLSTARYVWLGIAAMLLVGVTIAWMTLGSGQGPSQAPREGPSLLAGAVEVNGVRRTEIARGELVDVVGDVPALIRLDDASTAELDPGSRAVFSGRQGETRQLVELEAGRGLFKVRHEPRAFKVATPLGAVTVTGTEFTVALRKREGIRAQDRPVMRVEVTVGSVDVECRGRRVALTAGEQRVFGTEEEPLLKGAYAVNGQLHVNAFGTPEGKPITTGHADMKPSWSKTGDMLVFFRVTKFADDVSDWKTAICAINVDGTGFHELSDGTHTDFNPTWTRDGSNRAVFNRRNPHTGAYVVMQSEADGKPGDEVVISDTGHHTYAYSCLKDGRILVTSSFQPSGYFLMTPGGTRTPKYEPLRCDLARQGLLDRISISPGETKICFEFQEGHGKPQYSGRVLYVADFDPEALAVTNPRPVAKGAAGWDVNYPRWAKDESALLYQCNKTGKNQLYLYRLEDGSTTRLSTDLDADYLFANAEATPL